MKEVIILRHSEKDGDELTTEGVRACQELARKIGQFSIVISSDTNRAAQTAELLSGQVARRDPRANVPLFPPESHEELTLAQAQHQLGIVGGIWKSDVLIDCARKAGERLCELVEETIASLQEGGRSLIISHDGTMVSFEKLLRRESFESVDHSFGSLEGVVVDEQFAVMPFMYTT